MKVQWTTFFFSFLGAGHVRVGFSNVCSTSVLEEKACKRKETVFFWKPWCCPVKKSFSWMLSSLLLRLSPSFQLLLKKQIRFSAFDPLYMFYLRARSHRACFGGRSTSPVSTRCVSPEGKVRVETAEIISMCDIKSRQTNETARSQRNTRVWVLSVSQVLLATLRGYIIIIIIILEAVHSIRRASFVFKNK